MISRSTRSRLASALLAVVGMLAVAGCSASSNVATTVLDAPTSTVPERETVVEAEPTSAPAPEFEPTAEPEPTPEPEPTAEPTAEPEPTAIPAAIPDGWNGFASDTYSLALPPTWDGVVSAEEIDELVESVSENNASPVPAEVFEQYKQIISQGDAIIGIGTFGDNFNSYRDPSQTTLGLVAGAEVIAAQIEAQFETFTQNPDIAGESATYGSASGALITGTYEVSGQLVHLYQFITGDDEGLIFLTVTLFSGPDPELADEIFNSLAFG